MLVVLRNVAYGRLFAAQVVALIGTGLLTVALGLLAYDLAGSNAGAVLGTALTIKMLAYVGLAPVINALVARWPKKRVLIGADLIRAAMALALPFITDVWQIYIVIFLLQSASATFTPAFQSLIPTILTDEKDYTRALSLSRLAYDMEALVSPALAALLLTVLSYNNLFLGTVAGFLFSAFMVAITVLPKVPAATGPQSSLWHRTTLGARIFWRNRRLRSLLALNLVVAAPTALVLVNTVVYVRDVLHRPDTDLALALACFGVGSMIVALSAPRVLDRFGDRTVMLTGAAVIPAVLAGAAALTLLGVPGTGWWLLLGLWFLLGAANSTILTPSSRLLRDASTEETRPYVFTAQFSLSHACYILTYPLAGWVGAAAGLGWAAFALTIIAMIGSAGAFLSRPRHTVGTGQEPAEKEQSVEQPASQRTNPRP
ncbi:major Facilitator Superfamily protein [Pseudarthrobacter siccitolerans]|uniref:Major Facilitator Superfamily protein n=1 Tax=Pseudarthrobacter siccitolerans TaxID=861266 RepID=A0A024GZA8_9MICC|nr:MFS transporter [Pseudarthrobacter siccitolerans]CCQ45093.1 major Facilitator Superfamily protein [Pseudarthrobacter siccitolerans]